MVLEDGRRVGFVCAESAARRGLTVLDLTDAWTPFILSDDPSMGETGIQPYGPIFRALADERIAEVPAEHHPERYLELFGIPPTLRVIRERLGDEERHACHAAIDDAPLVAEGPLLRPRGEDLERGRRDARNLSMLDRRLERAAAQRGLASIEELAGQPRWDRVLARRAEVYERVQAIRALQEHLVCDGILSGRYERGVFDQKTADATELYHRRHVVFSGPLLTSGTRAAAAIDSREADFQALLRVLRERVASATGIIEDGSAAHAWGTVLGRVLDAEQLRADAGRRPAENPAQDLLSPATEAAARALGFTEPARALAALRRFAHNHIRRVAVRMPPLPRYHSADMELRAVIDRGDIRYDWPFRDDGSRRPMWVRRRAVITLYARDGEAWKALIRWPTTIGGWNDEEVEAGSTELVYKESPVGPRQWREVVGSPAWIPPPATPDDDLVRRSRGGIEPRYDVLGPGYRSAFGLAMLIHEREQTMHDGETRTFDEGIRTHGSVAYRSILRGTSHGCHRLHNHLALRLASFVLTHRPHRRVGRIPLVYERELEAYGHEATIEMTSRGYGFELVEPVPVMVTRGHIVGHQRTPLTGPPASEEETSDGEPAEE